MNNEMDGDSPEAWLRAAAALGDQTRGEAALDAVKTEERPKIPDALLCEVAEAGHYDQRMLTELTKHTTKNTWAECTEALMNGLEEGLIENSSGVARLTEKGAALLADARKNNTVMHASAISRIGRFLAAEDTKRRAGLAQAAKEQRGVNEALDRLLASEDGSEA